MDQKPHMTAEAALVQAMSLRRSLHTALVVMILLCSFSCLATGVILYRMQQASKPQELAAAMVQKGTEFRAAVSELGTEPTVTQIDDVCDLWNSVQNSVRQYQQASLADRRMLNPMEQISEQDRLSVLVRPLPQSFRPGSLNASVSDVEIVTRRSDQLLGQMVKASQEQESYQQLRAVRDRSALLGTSIATFISLLISGLVLLRFLGKGVISALESAKVREQEVLSSNEELVEAHEHLQEHSRDLEEQQKLLAKTLEEMELQMALHGHAARRFQSLFDGLPVGAFTFDGTGTVFEMNPMMGQMIGTPAHMCLLRHAGTIFGTQDRVEDVMNVVSQLAETGESQIHEWTVEREGGEAVYLQLHFLALKNHTNEVVGGICCAIDLTARNIAEQMLADSESRMRTLIEHAPASIAVLDKEGRVRVATNQWLSENEIDREAYADRELFELVPELRDIWQEALEEASTGLVVSKEEDLLLRRDGQVQWLTWHLQPWHTRDGQVGGVVAFIDDITERRVIEKRVRDSEERFDLAVRGLSVGIWDWNLITNEMYWAPRMQQILRVPETDEPYPHASFIERIHPDDREIVANSLQEHLAWKTPFALEVRILGGDDSYLWIHMRGQAVWSAGGRATRMVGSIDDITIRKAFEIRVTESEQRFRDVVEAAGEFIWECDENFRYTYLSERFATIMGIAPEEAIGRKVTEFFKPHEAERAHNLFDVLTKAGLGLSNIVFEMNSECLGTHHRLNAVSIKDANGVWIGFRGAALDVSLQHAAEAALVTANERIRSILESIQDCFFSVDDTFTFTYANSSAMAEFGLITEEVIGRELWEIVDECAHEAFYSQFERARMLGDVTVFEQFFPIRDQWIEYRISPGLEGFSVFFVDVSAKKRDEQIIHEQMMQINQANMLLEVQQLELEDANKMLEQIAYTDGLTGIANRKAYQEKLAEVAKDADAAKNPFGVILMDVDHFKKFNDTFGHIEGDDVLRQVGKIVASTVGDRGFVARYGGEEFIVLVENSSDTETFSIAEEVRCAIESGDWKLRPITASIGYSLLRADSESAEAVVHEADLALYQSKQNGRNRVTGEQNQSQAA